MKNNIMSLIFILFLFSCQSENISEKQKDRLSSFRKALTHCLKELSEKQSRIFQKAKISIDTNAIYSLDNFENKSSKNILLNKIITKIDLLFQSEKYDRIKTSINDYFKEHKIADSLKKSLDKYYLFLVDFCKKEQLNLKFLNFTDNTNNISFEEYYFGNTDPLLVYVSLLQLSIDILKIENRIILGYTEKNKNKYKYQNYYYFSVVEDKKQWYVGDTFKASVKMLDYIPDSTPITINDQVIPLENGIGKFIIKGELPYGRKKLTIKTTKKIMGRDSTFKQNIEYEVVR